MYIIRVCYIRAYNNCVVVYMCICTILSYNMQCSIIIVGVVIIVTIIVSKGWAWRAFNDYCTSVYYIICIVLSFECCKTKGGGGGEGGQMRLLRGPFHFLHRPQLLLYISMHLLAHIYTHI